MNEAETNFVRDSTLSLSVVVMTYNEVGTVEIVSNSVISCLEDLGIADFEVIIVDDGSTDGSLEAARAVAQRDPRVRLLAHARNLGIGETLRSGYLAASKSVVVAIPADGQFDVLELRHVLTLQRNEFISFYRHENESYGLFRNSLSYANRFLNRHLIGLDMRDVNWVTAFWREDIVRGPLVLRSSLIQTEICGRLVRSGHSVREIASEYLPRDAGTRSKGASPRVVMQAVRDVLRVRSAVNRK